MKENLPYLFSAAFLLLAILTFAYARKRDNKEEFSRLSSRVDEALNRLTIIETKAEIYFKGMSVMAAQDLHSPHTPELDILLEKFQRDEIQNEKELYKLKELLAQVRDSEEETPERRRLAKATLLLIHVRFEIGGDLVESFRQT